VAADEPAGHGGSPDPVSADPLSLR
jgi:hypothetical protein